MKSKQHWERIYTTNSEDEVSWFQKHAELSLKLIRESAMGLSSSIIDVGGGASTLVDDLLSEGYKNITVLDLSAAALTHTKSRLGAKADHILWIEASITDTELPADRYDVWHDRAVFHFLNTEEERCAYVEAVLRSVKPGGMVIVATFAEDGPTSCSGLPVQRYSAEELHAEFGAPFRLLGHEKELHNTPAGQVQQFVYCLCRRQI